MINKLIPLVLFYLIVIHSNGVLANACDPNDLRCQKGRAMEDAGIEPLATKPIEKKEDTDAKNTNHGVRSYELPTPSANQHTVINPGLDISPSNQDPNVINAINEANREANKEARSNISTMPVSNLNIQQIPAPRLESLKPLPTPDIRPVGGNVVVIPPSHQLAQSIYI